MLSIYKLLLLCVCGGVQPRKWFTGALARLLEVTDTSQFRQPKKYVVSEPHLASIRRDESLKAHKPRRTHTSSLGVDSDAGRWVQAGAGEAGVGSPPHPGSCDMF